MASYKVKHPEIYEQIEHLLKGQGVQSAAEIRDLITTGDQYDANQVAQAMRRMVKDGKILRDGDGVYWVADAAANGKVRPYQAYRDDAGNARDVPRETRNEVSAPMLRKIELAPFQKGREGHLVTVEQAPDEYEGIVQIQFKVNGAWFNMPFRGNVRICIGGGIPKWIPEQEMNVGVSAFRLVCQDGSFHEQNIDPHNPIVIAPGE